MSVVVATIAPQPEHAWAVPDAGLAAVPQVHAGEGASATRCTRRATVPWVMIEQWAGPEALAAHGEGEPFPELSRQLEGELAGAAQLQVLTAVPTGDQGKGAL